MYFIDRMRCGTGFAGINYDEAVNALNREQESRQRKIADLRADLTRDEESSSILKKVLQAKFGDAIQLDS